MPTISIFLGTIIRKFYCDHTPPHSTRNTKAKRYIRFNGNLLEGEIEKRRE